MSANAAKQQQTKIEENRKGNVRPSFLDKAHEYKTRLVHCSCLKGSHPTEAKWIALV